MKIIVTNNKTKCVHCFVNISLKKIATKLTNKIASKQFFAYYFVYLFFCLF